MFTLYFYWENRPGVTRKYADTYEGAVLIAKVRAANKKNLMSVLIVDDDYSHVLFSREELLSFIV